MQDKKNRFYFLNRLEKAKFAVLSYEIKTQNMTNKKSQLEVNDALAQSEAFVIKYKKQLIIGVVALAVVIAACVGGYFWLKSAEEKQQSQLTLGMAYISQQDYDKALKGDGKFPGYIKLASNHFTNASNLANFYAGISYARKAEGETGAAQNADVKNAIKYLEAYSLQGDHTITPAALATLANSYANDGQLDKAVETFKKAADRAANAAMSPEYLIQAGELLMAQKKNADAKEVFQQVKETYPNSRYCQPGQAPNGTITDPAIDAFIEAVSK